MDKNSRRSKRMNKLLRCAFSGKIVNKNDEVVLVENAITYVRKLGYLVSNFKFVFLLFFLFIFLTPFTFALDSDNWVTYKDNDMKVEITNWLGLGEKLGEATLKSHEAPDKPRYVSSGNQVLMWYEMNFTDSYINGLGDVVIIDLKSGKEIQRSYEMVLGQQTGELVNYVHVEGSCREVSIKNGSKTQCDTYEEVTPVYEWVSLESDDIPKGVNLIGVRMNVNVGEDLDIVFKLAGKYISKHAPVSVYETTNLSYSSSASGSDLLLGLWFNALKNITLQEVVLHNSLSHDFCRLGNSSTPIIEDSTSATDNFTFTSNLSAGNLYFIICNGSTPHYRNNLGCETNITHENLEFSRGYYPGTTSCGPTNTFNWVYNIIGIKSIENVPSDNNPPYFINGTPINQTITYGDSLYYDINATDDIKLQNFTVNDTRFKINLTTGLLEYNKMLPVGLYNINVTIMDNSTNSNHSVFWINITPAQSVVSLSFDLSSPQPYNVAVTPTCSIVDGEGSISLEKNGSSITSGNPYIWAVDIYFINCSLSSSLNYSYGENITLYTINKATPDIRAYINHVRGNRSSYSGNTVYFNGSLVSGVGDIYLYLNGSLINSGSSPLYNTSNLGLGVYSFKVNVSESQNYTSGFEIFYLIVSDTPVPSSNVSWFEFEVNILTATIFFILFISVVVLIIYNKPIPAGLILLVLGFSLLFNSFSFAISILFVAGGVICFFLK